MSDVKAIMDLGPLEFATVQFGKGWGAVSRVVIFPILPLLGKIKGTCVQQDGKQEKKGPL